MNKQMKRIARASLFAGIVILFAGCYPDDGGLTTEESVIVVTDYDQDFDFGAANTYYMPDTLAFLTNVEDPKIDQEQLAAYERTVLSTIETNMTARGYTRNDESATPDNTDLIINVAAIGLTNKGAAWYPGWGYWYPYYPPGWGWGPGWGWYYPPGWGGYPVYYSYETGTVIISIGSAEEASVSAAGTDNGLVPIHWTGAIDGLLSGVITTEDISRRINQAFEQSPYIQSN